MPVSPRWLLPLFVLLPTSLPAQERLPTTERTCYNDHGGLLSRADAARLEKLCRRASRDGIVLQLVTVASLDDFRPRPLSVDYFANSIFNEWEIDYEKGREAVLLFVSRAENEYRVVMGDAYSDRSRRQAAGVVRRVLVPAARRRRYSAGLRATMEGIYRQVVKPYVRQRKREEKRRRRREGVLQGP